jgi:hypothetical protein
MMRLNVMIITAAIGFVGLLFAHPAQSKSTPPPGKWFNRECHSDLKRFLIFLQVDSNIYLQAS